MKRIPSIILTVATIISSCAQPNKKTDRVVGTECEDCELMYEGIPEKISWQTTLAGPNEAGEPLIISGMIYKQDGKTPAPGVILYLYHTDSKGIYSPAAGQTNGRRHGHLRGWMKTDEQGRYEFKTIRPASYPNRKDPQHIHPLIKEPGTTLYWIDAYQFEDDPLLSAEARSNQEKRGGPGIIALKKNENGVWTGKRDIILGMNIPNYN